MKKKVVKTGLIILLVFHVSASFAQLPWKCDSRAIGSYNPGGSTFTDDTKLYSTVFDATGNVFYLDKPATTGIGLNAIGFRKQDGFAYGIRYTNSNSSVNRLCLIDSSGTITDLGGITGLKTNVNYYAGACDVNGDLYASTGSGSTPYQLYKINITTRVATDLGSINYRLIDMAFDPLTNVLYATSSNTSNNAGELLKINLSTNPATVTSLGSFNIFMFGLFFTDAAQLYGFGRTGTNTTAYYKLDKSNGAVTNAGAGPAATNADACSCPFRLSHTLAGKFNCLNTGQDTTFTIAITNFTGGTQNATFDFAMDNRFMFTQNAAQIKANIQSAFAGSSAVVTISSINGGTNNVISINSISVPVTTSSSAPLTFNLAIKAKLNGFNAGETILFQSVINVPDNSLNLGTDVSDNPITVQLDDATGLIICTPAGGPLPVTLTNFNGKLNQRIANLSWTTNNELNVQKFEIERSFDGVNFEKMAELSTKSTAGINTYQYADVNVQGSTSFFYRIKTTDNNGAFNYSPIIILKMNAIMGQTIIYPTTFINQLTINTAVITKSKLTIKIVDGTGNTLMSKTELANIGNNIIVLNGLSRLSNGLYFIKIYNSEKLIETKKIIKVQ